MGNKPTNSKAGGFVHWVSRENLVRFKDASAEAKLQWLEEANEFVNTFVSPRKRQLWQQLLDSLED